MMRFAVCAAALLLSGCTGEADGYDEALAAYSDNRVAEAEEALRRIVANPASKADDRARASRELGRIAWLVDGDSAAALAHLAGPDASGDGACDDARLRARILQESDGDSMLVEQADAFAARCDDPVEASQIRLRAAHSALDLASADPSRRAPALAAAARLTDELQPDVRSGLAGSAVRLQLALLEGDASAALQAWKDYFWLTGSDVPQGLRHACPAAAPLFVAGLAPGAAPQARLPLLDLLVRAGFAEAAERFASFAGLPASAGAHPLWSKAAAYFAARRQLAATILASDRRVARGGAPADLRAAVAKAQVALMRGAGLEGEAEAALKQAYGLYGQVGDTNGHASVHYGHVVQDERRRIEQYGHSADVAFVAVDNMISNGFTSWLWDGRAAVGGWASPDAAIVQVRPEWTSGPLSAWQLFSGGPGRERLLSRQGERAAADVAALDDAHVAYLPGLADRLAIQVAGQIGARARQEAGVDGDLKRAFLAEYWRANFDQSILAHEGRHALDRKLVRGLARLDDSNLEYRAKLSEIALARYPRLAFNNINEPGLGSDSGHGIANARVMRAYGDWIARNRAQVRGFDPGSPATVQIDRLTDSQLRAVARSLDPIAR
jgi:hypothetical protein